MLERLHVHDPRACMSRALGRLCAAVLTASALAGGCDVEGPDVETRSGVVDVDLEAYGVAQVVRDGSGHWRLLDDQGAALGRVDGTLAPERVELHATFAGQEGAFAWSAEEVAASCEGAPSSSPASLDGCIDALDIGARVAEAEGSPAPWALEEPDELQLRATCQNVSAWVWGSSCSDCIWASSDAFVANNNIPAGEVISFQPGTYQCSSGTVYTTCSRTWCWNGGDEILLE